MQSNGHTNSRNNYVLILNVSPEIILIDELIKVRGKEFHVRILTTFYHMNHYACSHWASGQVLIVVTFLVAIYLQSKSIKINHEIWYRYR